MRLVADCQTAAAVRRQAAVLNRVLRQVWELQPFLIDLYDLMAGDADLEPDADFEPDAGDEPDGV